MKVKALFLGSDNTHPDARIETGDVLYYLLTPDRGRPRVVSVSSSGWTQGTVVTAQLVAGNWLGVCKHPDRDGSLRLSACILFECAAVLEVQ
jgi:hypothetical protein